MLPLPYPTCMLTPLLETLVARYDEEELQTLCFELGVDYESLPAQGKAGKARALILERNRRGQAGDILARGRAERPDIDWDAVEPRLQSLGACAGRPGCWAAAALGLALVILLVVAAPAATRWLRRVAGSPTPPASFVLEAQVLTGDASQAMPGAMVTLELTGGVQEHRETDADGVAQFVIDGARQGQMANIVVELAGRRVAERAVRLGRAALPERIPVSP